MEGSARAGHTPACNPWIDKASWAQHICSQARCLHPIPPTPTGNSLLLCATYNPGEKQLTQRKKKTILEEAADLKDFLEVTDLQLQDAHLSLP